MTTAPKFETAVRLSYSLKPVAFKLENVCRVLKEALCTVSPLISNYRNVDVNTI